MKSRIAAGIVLACASVAIATAGEPIEIGERVTLLSEVLGEERTLLVSVPDGVEGDVRAPVLVLTDAETQFEHTRATVRFLARNGLIPDLIVVGITNTDRTRDLTPSNAGMRNPNGDRVEFPTSGGADRFLDFMETELLPFVEAEYPALGYRIFAGHSFGGLLAMHAFVTRPGLFQAAIAISGPMLWDDRLVLREARAYFDDHDAGPRALFISVGDEPEAMMTGFAELYDLLDSVDDAGFRWASRVFPDDDHGSLVLRSHERGLRFVFGDWKMPEDAATGWPAGTLEDAERHYARLSERLGVEVAIPETTLNLMGYRLVGEDRHDEALAVFRRAAEAYPGSANVWDSLGEGLEAAGDLAAARDSYAKAVRIGREIDDPNVAIYAQHLATAEAALAGQR
jgi:predicted alpha/beta superfamily hydrolase